MTKHNVTTRAPSLPRSGARVASSRVQLRQRLSARPGARSRPPCLPSTGRPSFLPSVQSDRTSWLLLCDAIGRSQVIPPIADLQGEQKKYVQSLLTAYLPVILMLLLINNLYFILKVPDLALWQGSRLCVCRAPARCRTHERRTAVRYLPLPIRIHYI